MTGNGSKISSQLSAFSKTDVSLFSALAQAAFRQGNGFYPRFPTAMIPADRELVMKDWDEQKNLYKMVIGIKK